MRNEHHHKKDVSGRSWVVYASAHLIPALSSNMAALGWVLLYHMPPYSLQSWLFSFPGILWLLVQAELPSGAISVNVVDE